MGLKTFIENNELVLVDFYAVWCGPCKAMAPILKDVKQEIGEHLKIIKIDVDKNRQASLHYQIQGVPTLILFKNKKIVWRQSGVPPKNQLIKIINQYL